MGGEEIKQVQQVFEQNWIAPVGPQLNAFEKALCDYNKVSYAVALASGTAAIHLALKLLGVTKGDVVFCQSFTFGGSAFPILYEGALPYFIDSEEETWNLSPEFLETAIKDTLAKNRRPGAIIMVHLYGMPAKVKDILTVAQKYHIPVIEDAAEGLGGAYLNRKLGSFGDLGIYSFNGNKIITTSGGGAMVSNNKEYVETARKWATQSREEAPHYEHEETGYNYRLSNIAAAIGLGQLKVLDERIKRKREIFQFYQNALGHKVEWQPEPEPGYSNKWLSCILTNSFDQREKIRLALEKENIESRPLWKPMHLQPVFKGADYAGEQVSDHLFGKGLCLPSGTALTYTDLERVAKIVLANL
jgi:dTDP-4-amino-4,6-dideoxygalactose transaminase